MPQKQLDLFDNEIELQKIVIDLHNIARRVENNGNPDGIGYSIREIADKLNEYSKVNGLSDRHAKILDEVVKKHGELLSKIKDHRIEPSESWYEP